MTEVLKDNVLTNHINKYRRTIGGFTINSDNLTATNFVLNTTNWW